MDFHEFTNALEEELARALPNDFTVKRGIFKGDKEGFLIQKNDDPIGEIFYTDAMYADYEEGNSIVGIVNHIVEIATNDFSPKLPINLNDIASFNKIKDYLFLCVDSLEGKNAYYQNVPIKTIASLSLKAYPRLIFSEEYSSVVTNNMMKQWGISPKALFSTAEKNTLEKMSILDMNLGVISVSNTYNQYGAGLMVSEACLKELHQKYGDFYVIPDSIHNIVIMPKSLVKAQGLTEKDIQSMMGDVHRDTHLPKEQEFSPNIFLYDKKALTLINTFSAYNVRIPYRFENGPKLTK